MLMCRNFDVLEVVVVIDYALQELVDMPLS